MEGHTYYCDWKKTRGQYRVWLVKNTAVAATGDNLAAAEEDLYEQICLRYGDGEAVIEYIRALPDSEFPREFATPFYYCVSPNVWISMQSNLQDLYEGGCCMACDHSKGKRNQHPVVVDEFPPYGDMLTLIKGHFGEGSMLKAVVISERLAKLLQLEEYFTLRAVVASKKSRKKYFELIPHQASQVVAAVAVKNAAQRLGEDWGYICDECGRIDSVYHSDRERILAVPYTSLNNQKIFHPHLVLIIKFLLCFFWQAILLNIDLCN
jgi:hypothetical protein